MNGRSFLLAIVLLGALITPQKVAIAQQKAPSPSAPVRTIADAIAQRGVDREVTVAGRASVSSGKLQSSAFDVAIEDTTAGIRIFSRNPQSEVHEGDSVVATGAIKTYRGSIELVLSSLHIVDAPRRIILPRELPINPSILERHSGQLVRVHGRVAGMGRSEGGQWLRLRDAASTSHGTVTVWIPANHGSPIDLAKVSASDSLVVTGVVTTYQDNADDPVVWQLIPRETADVAVTETSNGIPGWMLWAALACAIVVGATLSVSRIGARRQMHALRETEIRYRQLLALLPDAVIVHARGTVLFTNPAAAELLGLPSEDSLIGKPLAEFVHPDSRSAFVEVNDVTPPTDHGPRVRARMLSASSITVDVEVASSPCVYHDRPAIVLLARDITTQLRYERDLHALALVDELTGLRNRRAFTLIAEQELASARR